MPLDFMVSRQREKVEEQPAPRSYGKRYLSFGCHTPSFFGFHYTAMRGLGDTSGVVSSLSFDLYMTVSPFYKVFL
jgi:hypothetical protein